MSQQSQLELDLNNLSRPNLAQEHSDELIPVLALMLQAALGSNAHE
jgi:hypothetical protein